MKKSNKMSCPDCGGEMNHHTNKIEYSNDMPEEVDADSGGTLEEAHICPECGKTVMRKPVETYLAGPTRSIRRSSFAYHGIL
jgi:rRNA maturation endonuclease Nob1